MKIRSKALFGRKEADRGKGQLINDICLFKRRFRPGLGHRFPFVKVFAIKGGNDGKVQLSVHGTGTTQGRQLRFCPLIFSLSTIFYQ
jgi:hypothetical protein